MPPFPILKFLATPLIPRLESDQVTNQFSCLRTVGSTIRLAYEHCPTLHMFIKTKHIYPPITRKLSMRHTSSLRSCRPSVYHTKMGEFRFCAFPKGTTSKLAGFLLTVPTMLNVKQGSCEYQCFSHWFDPTRNQTPSLPIQTQTLYATPPSSGILNISFVVSVGYIYHRDILLMLFSQCK